MEEIKEFKLTFNVQHSKRCKDGKRRNILQYFLNNQLIFEQKYPYDETYDYGYQYRTDIYQEYILNGYLYQKRKHDEKENKIRLVRYPLSQKKLEKFNIPENLIIYL
jgi:hypothetical protein